MPITRRNISKAAAIQFDIRLGDIDANLSYVLAEIKNLSKEGVKLIVLPEMWSTGYAWRKLGKLSERTPEILQGLKKASGKGIVIIGSMVLSSVLCEFSEYWQIGPHLPDPI